LVTLVLGESLLVALGGAVVGLGLLYPAARLYAVMVAGGKTVGSYEITAETIWLCLGAMVGWSACWRLSGRRYASAG
jgi:hypothetical protein